MAKKDNLPKISVDESFALFVDDVQVLEYKGLRKLIKSSLDRLSELDRTLLILRFYFNCSGREISNLTGIPENQIASRLLRAKERLRRLIEDSREV
jgi:RNA polymerase sigma factor (sigma-70 family)